MSTDAPFTEQPGGADSANPSGPVLVVDFGAQYAQLIARRVRECRVRSELVPHDITPEEVLAKNPYGLILSGGPASSRAGSSDGAPSA